MVFKTLETIKNRKGYFYRTPEFSISYFDIYLTSDSSLNYRFITASKMVRWHNPEKYIVWDAHFHLPKRITKNLKIKDLSDWLPFPLPIALVIKRHPQLEQWLEETLLREDEWLCRLELD